MMNGYIAGGPDPVPHPRRYRVVARDGGWSIALDRACTRPFHDRADAVRIARKLQSQANRLNRPHRSAEIR